MSFVVRWCLLWCMSSFSATLCAGPVIDLNAVPQDRNLALSMQYLVTPDDNGLSVLGVLRQSGWSSVAESPDALQSPRSASTIWLRATLHNPSAHVVVRWLEISPWRLNKVDAWLMAESPMRVVERIVSGTKTPIEQRPVQNTRLLVPVSLAPHEKLDLVLRIESDSRPFLAVTSWNPSHFAAAETHRFLSHAIVLSVVATLVLMLFLQMNIRFMLLGLWVCVTFLFEAEKEGYLSFLIFNGSYDYGSDLRFSTAVWTKALFLCVSVYLLALEHHPVWRRVMQVACAVALVYTAFTWILTDNQLRILASAVNACALMVWPLMIPAAIKRSRPWQLALLVLLGVAWATSAFYSFNYILNLHYTAVFVLERLFIEIGVILGLVLIYARQKHDYDRALEHQLRMRERAERHRLERAVADRTVELNQALDVAHEALQAKSRFLGQVTHDLKSPLIAIMGYAQLLRVEGGSVGHMSGVIHNSASHMLNMVNRLVDYARGAIKAPAVPVDVYLATFLDNVQHEADMLAQRQHNHFELICAPDLPPVVQFDETFVREILLNLLENAAKFTQAGHIVLHVSTQRGKSNDLPVLQFHVRDTGCGIAASEQERIFDPFYRSESRTQGIGLGLPIVKELAGKLGGDISLSSQPGQGTDIRLTIPLIPGQEPAENALPTLPCHMLLAQAAINDIPHSGGESNILSAVDISLLRQWVEQGAMTDILEWCDHLQQQHPVKISCVTQIRVFAQRGSFTQLSRFLDTFES